MILELDLHAYCLPAALGEGLNLYKTRGVTAPVLRRTADGSWLLEGKVADIFNFVSHPRLRTDAAGRKLLSYSCDCPDSRKLHTPCAHCVCLAQAFLDRAEPEDIPGDIPAALPEVTREEPAEPVLPPEPTPEPPAPEAPAAAEEAGPEVPAPEIRSMEILLGRSDDGQDILWHPNDTEQVFHTNMGIIGTMGTGKTQFAKSLITQLYRNRQDNYDGYPLSILIFDYKGDYNKTKPEFVAATDARVYKPYLLPYNPLALNPGTDFKPLLPLHTANAFKDTISQIYSLGPKQEQLLLDCIVKAYRNQGIDPANPATWNRRAPTVAQVYRILAAEMEDRPADKLMGAMSKLHQFCLFEADPQRAVSLDKMLSGVVVIDISGYDSDIQSTVVAITLNQFYDRMISGGSSPTDGRYRQLRRFIMVDEADTFMGQDFPSLRRIMKEGREFGVGVILSTQSLDHYNGNEDNYARYVLSWVVHNVSDLKQKQVEFLFRLRPKSPEVTRNYAAIKGLQKHHSVVKLGNGNPLTIENKAFYQLYQQLQG